MHYLAPDHVGTLRDTPSVHHEQNNSQNRPSHTLERRQSFARWSGELAELEERISHSELPIRTQDRMRNCGTGLWVEYSPSAARYRVVGSRCGNRNCPLCRVRWARSLREKLHQRFALIKPGNARLLTLTLQHSNAPLPLQLEHLWLAFNRLRKRKLWKRKVRGCVTVLEITYNEDKKQWHPHLHIVLDGLFIPHGQLMKDWITVSHGSRIVDIRPIRSTAKTADYLTKYLTKAASGTASMPTSHRAELFEAWNASKFVRSYGSLRRKPDKPPDRDDYPTDWTYVAPFLTLIDQLAYMADSPTAENRVNGHLVVKVLDQIRTRTDPPPT